MVGPEQRDAATLQEIAAAVHATLAVLHVLGLVYNLRRRNLFDCLMHGAAAAYDAHAAHGHFVAAHARRFPSSP